MLPKFVNSTINICLVMLFLSTPLFSQKQTSVISADISFSGDGLGSHASIAYGIFHKNNLLDFGVNIQTERVNISGIRANYKRLISLEDGGRLKLFFYGNLTYQHSAYLSNNWVKLEISRDKEYNDYRHQKFRVIESYLGFGLMVQHDEISSSFVSIGIGGFETINKNYNNHMYRQKHGFCLQFQYSCYFNLIKRKQQINKNENKNSTI